MSYCRFHGSGVDAVCAKCYDERGQEVNFRDGELTRLRAENEKLKAQVLVNKSVADAAFSRADEAHMERADALLRLSAETSNRVFTDSEMVKLEIRAEAAEAKVLSLTKERDEWESKANEYCQDAATREMDNYALRERVKELEKEKDYWRTEAALRPLSETEAEAKLASYEAVVEAAKKARGGSFPAFHEMVSELDALSRLSAPEKKP